MDGSFDGVKFGNGLDWGESVRLPLAPGMPCKPKRPSQGGIEKQHEKQSAKEAHAFADGRGGLARGRFHRGRGRLRWSCGCFSGIGAHTWFVCVSLNTVAPTIVLRARYGGVCSRGRCSEGESFRTVSKVSKSVPKCQCCGLRPQGAERRASISRVRPARSEFAMTARRWDRKWSKLSLDHDVRTQAVKPLTRASHSSSRVGRWKRRPARAYQ